MRTYRIYTEASRDNVPFVPSLKVVGSKHDITDDGLVVYRNVDRAGIVTLEVVAYVPADRLMAVEID